MTYWLVLIVRHNEIARQGTWGGLNLGRSVGGSRCREKPRHLGVEQCARSAPEHLQSLFRGEGGSMRTGGDGGIVAFGNGEDSGGHGETCEQTFLRTPAEQGQAWKRRLPPLHPRISGDAGRRSGGALRCDDRGAQSGSEEKRGALPQRFHVSIDGRGGGILEITDCDFKQVSSSSYERLCGCARRCRRIGNSLSRDIPGTPPVPRSAWGVDIAEICMSNEIQYLQLLGRG